MHKNKFMNMFFSVFPLFILIPVVFPLKNTVKVEAPSEGRGLIASPQKNITDLQLFTEFEDYDDYQADGPRYPSDGGIHVDPQFPVYSNWQRTDDLSQFRINSPRKNEQEQESRGKILETNKETEETTDKYIRIKLPDDIIQQFGKRYKIGSGDHISNILGIPADHLPSLGSDLDSPRITTRATTPKPTTQTETPQLKKDTLQDYQDHFKVQDNYGGVDSARTRDHEYYNKKDLLPKLSKPTAGDGEKTPSQDPVDSSRSRSLWSMAWQAHIYFSGAIFVLLALYCSINICRLHLFSRLFSRGYFLSLNLCMVIVGVSRAIFLLWDAYNETGSMYFPVAYVLLNIGYPCITSAFAILFLALLRVTQVELLSPSVQTPRALAIFCILHLAISLGLDITVGLVNKLQYLLLLGQGIFIVWSLLLSAGYFYIYSTMKKVVSRQQCELNRAVYPKLMYDQSGSGAYSMRLPPTHSNPLARAVNLTLGVAVLGSLIGGVQLYGMIGMHGLLRADPKDIPDPWYGYQVALRVLELLICYLLAVVATTPLRQDGGPQRAARGPCSSCSPLLCCNGEGSCSKCGLENLPSHLEEEIYTEICSNNHSVRVLTTVEAYNQTINGVNNTELIQNPHCTATLALSTSGQHLTNTLARRRQQHGGAVPRNSQLSGDSSNTMDTALYSNMRSRPSSMLFNDAGFVRFRLGNDPSLGQTEMLRQSCQDLAISEEPGESSREAQAGVRESIRGSRSFDEGILTEIKKNFPEGLLERPQSNLSYSFNRDPGDSRQIKSELCSPDVEGLPGIPHRPASKLTTHNVNRVASPIYNRNGSDTDAGEQYEAPAGLILTETTKSLAAQVRSIVGYSESDLSSLDPVYVAGKSIYGYSRAPSRCSSISATQSFDMRVYGRVGPSGAATLGRPPPKPKLENKFYYYGSTRGQKKTSQREPLTPRPLLPSQRTMGGDTRLGPSPVPAKVPSSAHSSNPSQSIYDQLMGQQRELPSPTSLALQRSRSLGRDTPTHLPPRTPGPRTPTSVARKVLESVTKRRNKSRGRSQDPQQRQQLLGPGQLVQTTDGRLVALGPGNTFVEVGTIVDPRRARQISQDREEMLYGGREFGQGTGNGYGRPPFGTRLQGEVRQVVGTPPSGRAVHLADPRRQNRFTNGQSGYTDQFGRPYLDGQSYPDQAGFGGYRDQRNDDLYDRRMEYDDQFEDMERLTGDQQAARLAGNLASPPWRGSRRRDEDSDLSSDNNPHLLDERGWYQESELDSEISSLFSYGRDVPNLHLMSPLEYAAMIKQYSEPGGVLGKDITPDSGVVMESRNHSKEREKRDARSRRENFLQCSKLGRTRDDQQQVGVQSGQQGVQSSQQGVQSDQMDQEETSSSSEESSSEREEKGVSLLKQPQQYTAVPQTDPAADLPVNGVAEHNDLARPRKSSLQSNLTDSDPVSYELSADSLLSDSDKELNPGPMKEAPVSEKLSTVCNEIKARFLQD